MSIVQFSSCNLNPLLNFHVGTSRLHQQTPPAYFTFPRRGQCKNIKIQKQNEEKKRYTPDVECSFYKRCINERSVTWSTHWGYKVYVKISFHLQGTYLVKRRL
jgi:hypothetical protein